MIKRKLESKILESLKTFSAVGIVGSRQIGKTTLAKRIQKIKPNSVYLDLELPSDISKLAEPELYLSQFQDRLVIIDEIQRVPNLFYLLRALIDQDRLPGRFLILGSTSPVFLRQSSESLAGRIIYHELSLLQIGEINSDPSSIYNLWFRGGYPDSYLAGSNEQSLTWRNAFIQTFLERDVPQLGIRVPASQLYKFWMMIAHSHGQVWNASQIAAGLGISPPTARHYLDILEGAFLIRQLQPYCSNLKKRLIKSPKIYFRDSGLLHAILSINKLDDLFGNPIVGHSWEGFIIEQILSLTPEHWGKYFYRTGAQAEVDLVLFPSPDRPIVVEIKYSAAPKLSRGFWNSFTDLKCQEGYVVYPGTESYPISKQVTALPVTRIAEILEIWNERYGA
jgi:predicted AAA+ superfamily ATPase